MLTQELRRTERRVTIADAKLSTTTFRAQAVTVTDLSEGGAGLVSDESPVVGQTGHLTLMLINDGEKHWLQVEIRVANYRPIAEHFHIGVQFLRFLQPLHIVRALLEGLNMPQEADPDGNERRQQSFLDLTHTSMRFISEVLKSKDPRARHSAYLAMQSLRMLEHSMPKRRKRDPQ